MKRLLLTSVAIVSLTLAVGAIAEDRASIVNSAIAKHNSGLDPDDRNEKYKKMATSPFVFYRGTNHLYWMDFAGDERLDAFSSDKTKTWLQGDLHVYNFGSFDNDEQEVVYNVNDFDESFVGDYQYDVWRLAVSLVLIGRLNKDKNGEQYVSDSDLKDVVDSFCKSYLDTLSEYVGNDDETKTYFTADKTADISDGRLDDFLEMVGDDKPAKARKKMLEKWTKVGADGREFKSKEERKDKLDDPTPDEDRVIRAAMEAYGATLSGKLEYDPMYFNVKDVARRLLAGTGSLGTPRFYVLIEGTSPESDKDDRILDVKKQGPPSAFEFLPAVREADAFENDAVRHAEACKALTKHTDDHLGWMRLDGIDLERVDGDYSVRERSPYKESYPAWLGDLDEDDLEKFEDLIPIKKNRFENLAAQWGMVLATSHARADNDFKEEFVPFSLEKHVTELTEDKVDEFQQQVREIAFSYATQVNEDWTSWKATQ